MPTLTAMTDAQLRKVAEIAKLARSVKEKMSFSVGRIPELEKLLRLSITNSLSLRRGKSMC